MSGIYKMELAPVGSTGNNNHNLVQPNPTHKGGVCLEFVVEAIGGGPTVTYKLQGTMADAAAPASTDWEDIFLVPASTDTAAATRAVTAVGRTYSFISLSHIKFFKKVRLVTSANTNVTYSASLVPAL